MVGRANTGSNALTALSRLSTDVNPVISAPWALVPGSVTSIWTRGSIRGMTRGYVPRRWARFHHPVWLREVEAEKRAAGKARP